MHSVITPVHSLYMVFANAMGLQFLSSYSLPFLYRRMVRDSFHALGVEPVIHMKMSILCIAWCIPCGRCFSSSFGMLSGPGDFPFLRCDNLPYNRSGFCMCCSIDTCPYPGLPTLLSSLYGSVLLCALPSHGYARWHASGGNVLLLGSSCTKYKCRLG